MKSARFAVTLLGVGSLAIVGFTPAAARGGTAITANLPSGDAIINISGTADGAATYGGSTAGLTVIGNNQDDWFHPFDSGGLLEFTFQPGTYNFRLINSSTATTMFPALTSGQISQISAGAWTYNSPWVTDYLAFDVAAASDSTIHQLFGGAITPVAPATTGWTGAGYDNATDAYSEAINSGIYNKIVTGTGRYTGTVQSSYTFGATETLIFVVPDYALGDNAGSVSVLVTPAGVPEPASLGVLATGIAVMMVRRRRA